MTTVKVGQVWETKIEVGQVWEEPDGTTRSITAVDGEMVSYTKRRQPGAAGGEYRYHADWLRGSVLFNSHLTNNLHLPQPRHNTRCRRGHRAYVGLFAVQCETCDRIAEVERQEPACVVRVAEPVMDEDAITGAYEEVWQADDHRHPLRDGAIALWRAARIEALDAEGRR